jgi:glycosyltransferase involved in cell wall biosynthesis
MDICVLPGAEEGPDQTIIEAMAAGRPVITTGAGGVFDVIRDEVTGLIAEKGDRAKLAGAILSLVDDRGLARRLGQAARSVVLDRFPLDRMIDETLAAYEAAGATVRA